MHKMTDGAGKFHHRPAPSEGNEDDMAQYVPAAGAILAIGGVGAVLTGDATTVASSAALIVLAYLFARSLRPSRGEARE